MLEFIAAVYNEQDEINDLIEHVYDICDRLNFVDDGSTDQTVRKIQAWTSINPRVKVRVIEHTGLPETVKHEALQDVQDRSWVLMLDADERLDLSTKAAVYRFLQSDEQLKWDYVYFNQIEIIDRMAVRNFNKCKLFRKEAVRFPLNNIHADDQFEGRGTFKGDWVVYHRKSSDKQKKREQEYLETYSRLREEGHIDEGRERWLQGLHHYIRPNH